VGQARAVNRDAGDGRESARARAQALHRSLRVHIDYLRKQIKQADNNLDREVRNSALWEKYELLNSVPGESGP
jgi:hypothetical protein